MRIQNIDKNLEETIAPGDIVSFEFGDKLAVEGLVVETEEGLEIQLDEDGEEYITELLPLAIAAGGLAWSAYDAYQAAKAYRAGELTKSDLAKQVGTDVALSLAGGALAKGVGKGFKAFKKMWKKETPARIEPPVRSVEPETPNAAQQAVQTTTANADDIATATARQEPSVPRRNATSAKAGRKADDAKTKRNKRRRNGSSIGPVNTGSNSNKGNDWLSQYGHLAQMADDIQRLRQLAGLNESVVLEGTWAIPDTMEKAKELSALMQKPIPVEKASQLVYSLTGDDSLFDDFYELEDDGPGTDARPTIARWLADNMDLIAEYVDDDEIIKVLHDITEMHESINEGGMSEIHARITRAEDPAQEIQNMMNDFNSPEGAYMRREYEITAGENGLHGDDDFETIIDIMVDDLGINEAEYQGKKVTLNKPIRTGKDEPKKFKVYVKDGDKVKLVRFGHQGKGNEKTMKIKKSDPKRRKSFRARHNCKNPGPKTKARYWSCKAW